ncbi:MAG: outer membrane lipoprotein-sorting protein [SAR324 cluster bacterium]|nr:outer membrane lipoprotein-sorting protein [SAR324 cluster bacterium]
MKTTFSILIAFLLLIPSFAAAEESADEIMKKAHLSSYYSGDDGRSNMAMLVYAKGAKKPLKKIFSMLKIDLEEGGQQKFFIYFQSPADIKKTTFLVHKKVDEDDYRRLYLPASDKVIPIAGSRKQDPFMGSDYSYEDISGRHFNKDHHKKIGEEALTVKEKNKSITYQTFAMESVPKIKEEKIAKIRSWIDKKTYTPIRVEFINHDGKVYKRYQSYQIQKIDGFPTIMRRVMESPLDDTRTIILLNPKKTGYNLGVPEDLFSDRSLKNPPMKYLN